MWGNVQGVRILLGLTVALFEEHLWYRTKTNLNLFHQLSLQPAVQNVLRADFIFALGKIYIRHPYTIRWTADIFSLNMKVFWLTVFWSVKHLLSHKLEDPPTAVPSISPQWWTDQHVISIVRRRVLWRRDAQENRALPQLSWKPHQSPCLCSLKTDQPL